MYAYIYMYMYVYVCICMYMYVSSKWKGVPYHLWAKMWHPEDPPTSFGNPKTMWEDAKAKNNVYVFVCGVYLAVSAQMPTRGAPVQPNIESAARLRWGLALAMDLEPDIRLLDDGVTVDLVGVFSSHYCHSQELSATGPVGPVATWQDCWCTLHDSQRDLQKMNSSEHTWHGPPSIIFHFFLIT